VPEQPPLGLVSYTQIWSDVGTLPRQGYAAPVKFRYCHLLRSTSRDLDRWDTARDFIYYSRIALGLKSVLLPPRSDCPSDSKMCRLLRGLQDVKTCSWFICCLNPSRLSITSSHHTIPSHLVRIRFSAGTLPAASRWRSARSGRPISR